MMPYTSIEEKFCISAGKNVAVEVTHLDDGKVIRQCLSHSCKNNNLHTPCHLERQNTKTL